MKTELKMRFQNFIIQDLFHPRAKICFTDPMHYIYLLLWVGSLDIMDLLSFLRKVCLWSVKANTLVVK